MSEKNSLISSIVIWIERVNIKHKRQFINSLKMQLANNRIRNLKKNNFDSLLPATSSDSNEAKTTHYVSIGDFKPAEQNYSSINVRAGNSDFQTRKESDFESIVRSKEPLCKISKKMLRNIIEDNVDRDTFLENWMVRDKHEVKTPCDDYPKSNYCFKKIRSYHCEALESIKKYPYDKYCRENVKPEGFWIFKNFDRMKFTKEPLNDSLTFLSELQVEKSLDIFEHLLKAGGEMETSKLPIFHVYCILEIISKENDDLKEEAYLHLIKQLQSKKLVYLRILCVYSCIVKPSARMYLPLLNFLVEQNMATVNQSWEERYNYCFFHLIKSNYFSSMVDFDQPRTALPSLMEISYFMGLRKVPITVNFPREKVFFVESFTTTKELINEIIQFYDLDSQIEYIVQINGCFLDRGILLDQLNKFENRHRDQKIPEYGKFKAYKATIVLKNMNDYKKSKRCFNIMYNYYVCQYLKGLFPLNEEKVLQIAAYIMHSQMDDESRYTFDLKALVSARIRKRLSTQEEKEKCKKHILNNYFKFNGTRIEARKKIIAILSQSKGYQTHFFRCSVFLEDLQEVENWVGLKVDRLILIDPQTGRYVRQIKYNQISEWGASKSEICIKVKKIGRLHIETLEAEVLASIFENYLEYLYKEGSVVSPKIVRDKQANNQVSQK